MKKRKLRQQKKSNKKKGQYCTTTILIFSYRKADFFEILSGHLSMKCDYAIIQSNASIFKGKMIYLIND